MDLLDGNTPTKGRIQITEMGDLFNAAAIAALTEALNDLKGSKVTAAGIGLASAVIEKHIAEHREKSSRRMLRAAASAGADLSQVDLLTTIGEGDGLTLVWQVTGSGDA